MLLKLSWALADEGRDVMKPACADDGAAQQGYALGGIASHTGGYRQRRTDGGQDGHDELNDVLNRFFFHSNRSLPPSPP